MSTLVDELLQDFEDSGSEQGDERNEDDLLGDGDAALSGSAHAGGDMDLDGDEGEDEDADMGGFDAGKKAPEDPEEAKARVEKMQLKGVNDVRSVAGLMKTLEPVLEVSENSIPSSVLPPFRHFECLHSIFWTPALTMMARLCRKSHTFKHNRQRLETH